jgi:trehalose-phosphatase
VRRFRGNEKKGMMMTKTNASSLPSALDNEKIDHLISSRDLNLFLDYDGTLTKIVENPSKAFLSRETRDVLRHLSSICTVVILSGRDVQDVRKLVGIDGMIYAGSHGFDIIMANGERYNDPKWLAFLPSIDHAEKDLRKIMNGIAGVNIERKRFGVTVHYRQVKNEKQVQEVRKRFTKVASSCPKLRKKEGKKVFELLPNVRWDKGRALSFLLNGILNSNKKGKREEVLPLFIGDDLTDEDAFKAIRKQGLGIIVANDPERSTLARYILRNPTEVRSFLEKLVEILEGKSVWASGL